MSAPRKKLRAKDTSPKPKHSFCTASEALASDLHVLPTLLFLKADFSSLAPKDSPDPRSGSESPQWQLGNSVALADDVEVWVKNLGKRYWFSD